MIEVTIIGNEFDHIKLGDGEESKSLMAYNATCKEIGKKIKYANILVDHRRNYADEGDDIIFEQDFHDDVL